MALAEILTATCEPKFRNCDVERFEIQMGDTLRPPLTGSQCFGVGMNDLCQIEPEKFLVFELTLQRTIKFINVSDLLTCAAEQNLN